MYYYLYVSNVNSPRKVSTKCVNESIDSRTFSNQLKIDNIALANEAKDLLEKTKLQPNKYFA